jgi:hypothetical protein
VRLKLTDNAVAQADRDTALRLEELAAWHRRLAERAGATWVWEAHRRRAEELEARAAAVRDRLAQGRT